MKIVCISDTHDRHDDVVVPEGDMVICAGDISCDGSLYSIKKFCIWFEALPHKHKILVAGNHDWLFEKEGALARIVVGGRITYLQDEAVKVAGLKIYGSPWQPEFCDWAFNFPRGGAALRNAWNKIPDDTDILITHTGPKRILDIGRRGDHLGCGLLRRRIDSLLLKLNVFGHIHSGHGIRCVGGKTFVNASICDEHYEPVYKPIVVEI